MRRVRLRFPAVPGNLPCSTRPLSFRHSGLAQTPRNTPATGADALPGAPTFLPNPRRILWPTVVTLVLLLPGLYPLPALRDSLNGLGFDGGRLVVDAWYLRFAPLCNLADALSLLTLPQHYGVAGTVLLWWAWRRGRRLVMGLDPFKPAWEALALVGVVAALVGVYAIVALLPRPTARLQVYDPELVVVDFHSHTSASHDGRPGFDVEKNRAWHQQAGYHVSYVTDHLAPEKAPSWREIERGLAANPARAGERTIIATGIEAHSNGTHVNVLGATARDTGLFGPADHLKAGARLASGEVPVVLQTIPADLARFAREGIDSVTPTIAIEVNDAAPRGLAQNLRDRPRILRMVDSLNLAPLAASDNHGWGATAAAWTLVRIPGWRQLPPDTLARRIEAKLRTERRTAVRTIERRTPQVGPSVSELLFTVPAMLYDLNASISAMERLSWIIWIWGTAFIGPWLRFVYLRRMHLRRIARDARLPTVTEELAP